MLLAFMHCFGAQSNCAELCIVPDKPDQFSVPVRVDTLEVTDAAVLRLGPIEAITVRLDPRDNGMVIEPMFPAKLFITPDLPQYPGVHVKRLKILRTAERQYQVYFLHDKDREEDWRAWHANHRDKQQ
jgi:hypothetical protein